LKLGKFRGTRYASRNGDYRMLTPTTHKIAIYLAFALLSSWLLFSLLPREAISPYGSGQTTSQEESEKHLIDRRIAAYTLAVAAFTAILALATIALGAVTAIGIRNQSRETKILQRAYITARRRGIEILGDGNIIGHLAFVNVGNLPARKFCAAVNICWSNNPNLSEFVDLQLGPKVLLPAKTSFPSGTPPLPKTDIPHFHAKEGWIYIWGRVSYTDGFDQPRWLKFCHRYNCKSSPNRKGGISRRRGRHHHHYNEDDGGAQT